MLPLLPAGTAPERPVPVFLSVVVVVRDAAERLAADLRAVHDVLAELCDDHEIVVVDNASRDSSVEVLRTLTREDGIPNLQVFALANQVDPDTAVWVGLDSALGDFVAVYDPCRDDPGALPALLERAVGGADIVSGTARSAPDHGLVRRALRATFRFLYLIFHGARFVEDTPAFRLLSRSAVNLVLKHPATSFQARELGQLAGFVRADVVIDTRVAPPQALGASLDRGVRLLLSSTRAPLRSVTWLATLAATLNLLYTVYVIVIYFLKEDVTPGWTTLSLQTSGMFLLISLILLVLGEYVLQLAAAVKGAPAWHVAREFKSAIITRSTKLNIVDPPGG